MSEITINQAQVVVDEWIKKVGVRYFMNKSLSLYGSVAHSGKEPNRNDFVDSPFGVTPKNEYMTDYEAGLHFENDKLFQFDVNVYSMNYDNQLVLTGAVNDVGAPLRTNVSKSYRRGVELSSSAYFNQQRLKVNGNITFSENKIIDFQERITRYYEDYTSAEEDDFFLEGTGSILLDRENGKAYCALSPRADDELFIEFCEDFDLNPIIFEAFQTVNGERKLIYHTNVMLCIGETFAVICADSIDDKKERKMVIDSLKGDDKEVIYITEDQVNNFAGNMLEVKGANDRRYLIMSSAAQKSLTKKQIAQLEEHVTILSSSLDTIEACGGGSARCMMAEIFLPKEEI